MLDMLSPEPNKRVRPGGFVGTISILVLVHIMVQGLGSIPRVRNVSLPVRTVTRQDRGWLKGSRAVFISGLTNHVEVMTHMAVFDSRDPTYQNHWRANNARQIV